MSHVFGNGVVKCVIVCFAVRGIMSVTKRSFVGWMHISVTYVEMFIEVRKVCMGTKENTIQMMYVISYFLWRMWTIWISYIYHADVNWEFFMIYMVWYSIIERRAWEWWSYTDVKWITVWWCRLWLQDGWGWWLLSQKTDKWYVMNICHIWVCYHLYICMGFL